MSDDKTPEYLLPTYLPVEDKKVPEHSFTFAWKDSNLQAEVQLWLKTCFVEYYDYQITALIRCYRFFEEAVELIQSLGMTREQAHKIVDYVYDRPVGRTIDEIGGVTISLLALCIGSNVNWLEAATGELKKNWLRIPKIRARQKEKLHPGENPYV